MTRWNWFTASWRTTVYCLRCPLQGVPIKIQYTSVLAQAQRALGVVKLERVIGFAGMLAEINPDAMDNYDTDEMARQMAEMEGAAAKVIRDPALVQEIREQRAQQQQMAQMAEMANSAADTTKKLADAKTDQPSALDGVMQGLANAV